MAMWKSAIAVALAITLAACGQPDLHGLGATEEVKVGSVRDGDQLVLEDGRTLYLIGIEAPSRQQPLFAEARNGLERLALARPVKIAIEKDMPAPRENTVVGHLFVLTEGGRWVWAQEALLLEGLVRVHIRKGGTQRAAEMLAAEAVARQAQRGVWAERGFAIKDAVRSLETLTATAVSCKAWSQCRSRTGGADTSASGRGDAVVDQPGATPSKSQRPSNETCTTARAQCEADRFQIVDGRVRVVFVSKKGGVHLNFGDGPDAYKTDFSSYVGPDVVTAWPNGAEALKQLEGRRVRVRGYLESFNGPSIELNDPLQLEVLPEKT